MRFYGKNKYNNQPTIYNNQRYDSILESQYAAVLDLLKKAGEVAYIERQPRFPLEVNGHKICDIIPDFLVETKSGATEIHEVKGRATDTWLIKWRLFQALYPEFKCIVIKKGDF